MVKLNTHSPIYCMKDNWENWLHLRCTLDRMYLIGVRYVQIHLRNGTGTTIYQVNWIDTVADDALAPAITRSSTGMVLTMQDKRVLVFHMELFQTPLPSQCLGMIENVITSYPGIILRMHPANERRRYIVMSSLIGWVHMQNNPWLSKQKQIHFSSKYFFISLRWVNRLHETVGQVRFYCSTSHKIWTWFYCCLFCWVTLCSNNFAYKPSQWETTLQCNVVSHWLGAHTNDPWLCNLFTHICQGNFTDIGIVIW